MRQLNKLLGRNVKEQAEIKKRNPFFDGVTKSMGRKPHKQEVAGKKKIKRNNKIIQSVEYQADDDQIINLTAKNTASAAQFVDTDGSVQ